jgi:hypothetical protein
VNASRGYLAWALLVVPLWIVLALCTSWEPVMGDGWGHFAWHRTHTVTPGALAAAAREIYLYENPRLGQLATLLSYTPGPYHLIVTPLIELGVLALLTVLALGRWPRVRRADDAFVALLVTATFVVCAPQIGPLLFYRPFTGNYTFGLALNLCWLVPYRLALVAPRPAWLGRAPGMAILGLAAGLCNEHTGLAFLGLGVAATIVAQRRGQLRGWMIAGLVGLGAGYVLLLTAPGQHLRYGGLAAQAGIVERILDRGVRGNLAVIGRLAVAIVPMLPLVIVGLIEHRARRARAAGPAREDAAAPSAERWVHRGLAIAGLACTLTLLASPKIGPRLFAASVALITAGLIGGLAGVLHRRWLRAACAIAGAGALIFVEVRLLATYSAVGAAGAIRRARLEHGAPGATVAIPPYPVAASRYFIGDDFPGRHEAMANLYGLQAVTLDAATPPPRR